MTARLTALLGAYGGDRKNIMITEKNALKFWEMTPLVYCHDCHILPFQRSTYSMVGEDFSFNKSQVSNKQLAAFQVRSVYLLLNAIMGRAKYQQMKICHSRLLYVETMYSFLLSKRPAFACFESLHSLKREVVLRFCIVHLYSSRIGFALPERLTA